MGTQDQGDLREWTLKMKWFGLWFALLAQCPQHC